MFTTRIPGLETAKKIHAFRNYRAGWNYGEGQSPLPDVIRDALTLNNVAATANLDTNAFLGPDGEIRVTVYYKQLYLQFTIEGVDLIEYVREEGNTETARHASISLSRALIILEDFELEICRSSVSSTATGTTQPRDIFKTLPSSLRDAAQVFQWLSRSVQTD